jgi:hypothetical protein
MRSLSDLTLWLTDHGIAWKAAIEEPVAAPIMGLYVTTLTRVCR